MPKVQADFSQISSSFEPLEEKQYRFKLLEINDQANDDEWKAKNANTNKQPALVFVSEVQEGERVGAQINDYIYTKTKEGKVNKVGLGRIKAYAEAILGQEKANSPEGIDTDELISGQFDGVMKKESYKDSTTGEQKTNVKLAKLLPIS